MSLSALLEGTALNHAYLPMVVFVILHLEAMTDNANGVYLLATCIAGEGALALGLVSCGLTYASRNQFGIIRQVVDLIKVYFNEISVKLLKNMISLRKNDLAIGKDIIISAES